MAKNLSPSTKVVFDTNVLISAFIFKKFSGEIYNYCVERYTLYTSQWILDELTEKLTSKKFKLPVSLQEKILSQVNNDARIVYPTNDLPTNSRDPDDNNVLQITLFVNADFLITGDRDLLDLKKILTTEILSPNEFFEKYIA